jgi:hypothetical protein
MVRLLYLRQCGRADISEGLLSQIRAVLGASLGYQGAAIFAGGLAPLVATLLLKLSGGESWVLALYLMVMAAISLVSIYLIAETRQVDLSEAQYAPVSPAVAAG